MPTPETTVDDLAHSDRLRFRDELTDARQASLDEEQRRVVAQVVAELDG